MKWRAAMTATMALVTLACGAEVRLDASGAGAGGVGGTTSVAVGAGGGGETTTGGGGTDPVDPPPVPACGRTGPPPDDDFARLVYGVAASWAGTRNTQWDGDQNVVVTFGTSGVYSAHCTSGCTAMYWGDDDDSDKKHYEVVNLFSNGEGWGEIDFVWTMGSVNSGELRHIKLNDELTNLQFEAWKGDYGPLTFDLSCTQ